MEAQPIWLTTAAQISAACLSPIIAIVGGWIAWQQVRINRNKLKLDRFDRRFAVHEAAMSFVASVCTHGAASVEEMNGFLAKTRGTRFLLSKEIADYLEEIYRNAGKLHAIKRSLDTPNLTEDKRSEYSERWMEIETWFQQQLAVIPDRFAPFLHVDDI